MRLTRVLTALLLVTVSTTASACSSTTSNALTTSSPTPTPCVDDPRLVAAVDVIWAAKLNPGATNVYGQAGGGTSNNLLELVKYRNLAAIENPKGDGVVVSVVAGGGKAFARDTVNRTGWLVMDGSIYPIDANAAQAFGLRWNGYPTSVQDRAGLASDYFDFDSYGISDFVAYNADTTAKLSAFMVEANGLCETPTGLGQ